MQNITLSIVGMHCVSCALNIDFEMEDLEGVQKSETNYAKQKTVVTYDPQKVTVVSMLAVIKGLDYDAVAA